MRLWGMTIRWPWDNTRAARHAERVDEQELLVANIHDDAMQQKRSNNVGPLLESIFVTPDQEKR